MKKNLMFAVALSFILCVLFLSPGYAAKNLETQKDKASYSVGWDIGNNLKRQSIDIDADIMSAGIKDALSGSKPLLTDDERNQVMMSFQKDMQDKQMKLRSETGEKNKKAGEEFLAKNKKIEGVKVTSSGLQYKIIKQGTGEKPKSNDTVTVNYEGRLIDGTVFDSSYKRGQPATFAVGGVIAGWTEALQLMKVGSKYELFIPSNLAYGERGTGADIGPNSVLIFTVELISIKKP
ncbi:MAG: FKBP-type peptidyl-prolyl cis-trans isomerase [Elusimicrobiota bacterium]|nr:FKBP-type peptidyl-prolyl cis-trans isomerase [Elusimicrobiota bacterium]